MTSPLPPFFLSTLPTSPREFLSAPIVLVSCSMYPTSNVCDPRLACALLTCGECATHHLPLICVDDSPSSIQEEIKWALERAGNGWVRVVRFKGKGKKGASIRQALARAMTLRGDTPGRWAIIYTEMEKVDFVRLAKDVAGPILGNEADIVTPDRNEELFKETYAMEQYHSESFARRLLNMAWMREGGTCELDWLFGPIAWEGSSVGPFYLESDEESYDAQMVPAIRAFREIGARWVGLKVSYKHHELQQKEEENNPAFCEKRMAQLLYMVPKLICAFNHAGRLPLVVVTGAAGNLGQKIVARLLTTDACSFLGVPTLSRPCTPGMESEPTQYMIKPKRLRLLLLDARPCPNELLDVIQNKSNGHQVEYRTCDFSKYDAKTWVTWLADAYCVFMLAAQNPFPEATDNDAFVSTQINSNLLEACAVGSVDRVVFASSNHVMGGMLQSSGLLAPNASPKYGTKYRLSDAGMDSTLYATAKVAGEVQMQAMISSGRLKRAIVLRVGWCQPGENLVSTISVTGTPTRKLGEDKAKRTKIDFDNRDDVLTWFRAMHLKNEDLDRIVDCCVAPGLNSRAPPMMFVNAVSHNPNSRWIVVPNDLGYVPVDYNVLQ